MLFTQYLQVRKLRRGQSYRALEFTQLRQWQMQGSSPEQPQPARAFACFPLVHTSQRLLGAMLGTSDVRDNGQAGEGRVDKSPRARPGHLMGKYFISLMHFSQLDHQGIQKQRQASVKILVYLFIVNKLSIVINKLKLKGKMIQKGI